MASNKWETLEARELDETWEMNIHINPIDEDTEEIMKRHKAIFENHADDFVAFIKHTENARKQEIQHHIYQERLKDFAKVYEPGEVAHDQESLMQGASDDHTKSVMQAIEMEDQEKVTDLKEFAKSSKTVTMDPSRFFCVLGQYAGKQAAQKRLYLQALPFYIEEREEKLREMDSQDPNSFIQQNQKRVPSISAEQQKKTVKNQQEYQKIYQQMSVSKKDYLDRLNASEVYRNNQSSGSGSKQGTTRFQFCSSGNKEQQALMNQQMLKQDILCRKNSMQRKPSIQQQANINLQEVAKSINQQTVMKNNSSTEMFKNLVRNNSTTRSRQQSTNMMGRKDSVQQYGTPLQAIIEKSLIKSKLSQNSHSQKRIIPQYLMTQHDAQSKWVPIKKVNNLVAEGSEISVTEYGNTQGTFNIPQKDASRMRNTFCKSTLGVKSNIIPMLEQKNQIQVLSAYKGLNKSYLVNSVQQLDNKYLINTEKNLENLNSSITFARLKLKISNYVEPPFKVLYELQVPDALKQRVNRLYVTFVQDCLNELEPVKNLAVEDYKGTLNKGIRGGLGMLKMENGDLFKGHFKNGKRHGSGVCMFKSGALYKGDFSDDQPHGQGILYSGKNEVLECRFEHGQVPKNGRVRIMLQDGSYYDGNYSNNRRHGQGTCWYPNGEMFEGNWQADKRIGRGKMRFLNGSLYHGQFIADKADGNGQIEDQYGNFFQVEHGIQEDSKDSGCIINGRLQNRCSVTFINGDKYIGIYKDGRPNGFGQIHYKNSVPSTNANSEFEVAQYYGNFFQGKKEGKGKMIWSDGSIFEGQWKNDMRHHGRMIMSNGFVFIGTFKNDKFYDEKATLMMPNMTIYKGGFTQNKTHPICMLLYPSGDIYYGQHTQYAKSGCGKLIMNGGGFQEGFWESDKIHGENCRIYDDQTGDLFVGQFDEGKKMGRGRLYDAEKDEVYEGDFENDRRSGPGTIYRRNGEVLKGDFRNNYMEGPFEVATTLNKVQVQRVFNNAQRQGDFYVTVNKMNQEKVSNILKQTVNKNQNPYGDLSTPLNRTSKLGLGTSKSGKKMPNFIDVDQL